MFLLPFGCEILAVFEAHIALQLTVGAGFRTFVEVFGMFVFGANRRAEE